MPFRLPLAAFAALLAFGSATLRADELQDAKKLLREGDLAGALDRAEAAVAAKPGSYEARFLEGVILAEQKRTDEAARTFTLLTQDFPEMPDSYNNLAVIYYGRGEYERARDALHDALRANPGFMTAYENLGDVYAALAAQAYRKAIDLDPKNAAARAKLAAAREVALAPTRRTPRKPTTPGNATTPEQR